GTLTTITSATPLGLQAFGDTLGILMNPPLLPVPLPESTIVNITSKLEVQVADLEGLLDYQTCGWDFLLCGGLRLARIAQSYNFYDSQNNDPVKFRALLSTYNFQGAGPVIAVEARHALGQSGLTLYASTRGSIVFGSALQYASFAGQSLRNDDPNPQFATQQRERGLPIGELEVGLEYDRCVGC